MSEDNLATTEPSVRIDGARSVGVGRDNLGTIHIGDLINHSDADELAKAAQNLADRLGDSLTAEADLGGIPMGSMVDLSWRWAPGAPNVDHVFDRPVVKGGPRSIPGIDPPGRPRPTSGSLTGLFGALYVHLPHGRLAIVGPAASGKSATMLALLLALLRHRQGLPRENRDECPVPVVLAAAEWDARRESLRDWVTEALVRQHGSSCPGLAGALPGLLATGRVALFIDGLEELQPAARDAALRRLEREEVALRVTVTSCEGPFRDMGGFRKRRIPMAAVLLDPVTPDQAEDFLLSGHPDHHAGLPSLRRLVAQLRTERGTPIAEACGSPLTLSLINDVYAEDGDPADLLDRDRFGSAKLIRTHLLKLAFHQAYPDHERRASHRVWLQWMAINMGNDRNLRWWEIPTWLPAWRQRTAISLLAGVAAAVVFGAVISPAGASLGAVLGLVRAMLVQPPKTTVVRWKPRRPTPAELGKAMALAAGVGGCTLPLAVLVAPWVAWVAAAFLALQTLTTFLVTRVWSSSVADEDDLTLARSRTAIPRSYRLAGLSFGLGLAVSNALWTAGAYAYFSGDGAAATAAGLAMGLTIGIAAALPLLLTPSLRACEFYFLLTGRRVDFMAVLREAHQRKILAQTGNIYQFRYPELQDELKRDPKPWTASPPDVQ